MHISIEKLNQIEKQYREFKKTPCYEERKAQLKFADFAREIIEKLLQTDSITNEDLTALIQIFSYGSRISNVKTYIESLKFDEQFSNNIFNKFLELGLTGFTGIGTAKIHKPTDDNLIAIREFLIDVSKANSEEAIKKTIIEFDNKQIPQVKSGIYSPWLYYLQPTICPIVAGRVKKYLNDLGHNGDNYLDLLDILKTINQTIGESDYGPLDGFIDKNGECGDSNYWLFIVPTDGEFKDGKLWEYCKQNLIAAMQYQYGPESDESDHAVYINHDICKQIKIGDRVIVYNNKKIIGGIGEVTRRFFNDNSKDNGFDGRFGQRIGLRWITEEFEIDSAPIWDQLSKFKNGLSFKTIHKITEEDYTKITNYYINGETIMDEQEQSKSNLLLSKKQIILYGPPGTGKTYSARMLATEFLKPEPKPPIDPKEYPDEVILPPEPIAPNRIGKNITVVEWMPPHPIDDSHQPDYFTEFPKRVHYKRALRMMLGRKEGEIGAPHLMILRTFPWFQNYEIIKEWNAETGAVTITKKGAELLQQNKLISSWELGEGKVIITEKGRNY